MEQEGEPNDANSDLDSPYDDRSPTVNGGQDFDMLFDEAERNRDELAALQVRGATKGGRGIGKGSNDWSRGQDSNQVIKSRIITIKTMVEGMKKRILKCSLMR